MRKEGKKDKRKDQKIRKKTKKIDEIRGDSEEKIRDDKR